MTDALEQRPTYTARVSVETASPETMANYVSRLAAPIVNATIVPAYGTWEGKREGCAVITTQDRDGLTDLLRLLAARVSPSRLRWVHVERAEPTVQYLDLRASDWRLI